jgi:hypothetical protein
MTRRGGRAPFESRHAACGTGGAVAGIAISLALLGPAGASAMTAKAAAKPVVQKVSHHGRGRSHWTPGRMRRARPAPTPDRSTAAPRAIQFGAISLPIAKPLTDIESPSNRTSGKVFYTAGKWDYDCSGTAVRSRSRSLVISAGHCGEFEGPRIRNWTFVPAFHDGKAPFGKWTAKRLAAPAGWAHAAQPPRASGAGGDPRFDVSAATMGRLHGKTLQSVVGGARIAFNTATQQQYEAIGYPAAGKFDGRSAFECQSNIQLVDLTVGDPAPVGMACDMTDGSSGGGWFDAQANLVSVTSYGYTDQPDFLYGPYFGDAIAQFYRSVSGR